MHILVLGSAAGGGFPQWNSNAPGCRRARAGDKAALPRTQASLAVSADGRDWFLLNAAPDIRAQIDANRCLWPRDGLRSSPIAGIVLTGADVDAVAGLLTLRERQVFALYATASVLEAIAADRVFRVLAPDCVPRRTLPLGPPVALCDGRGAASGLIVEAFAVPGKVPLWLERADADPDLVEGEYAIGLALSRPATGARFVFVPGCAAMTEGLERRLAGAPLVFFDGTLWRDDEMIRAGVGAKTGRRMGHMSMDGTDGTIAALAPLGIGRKIFIHVNNTNPALLADSPERAAAEAAGWTIAWDGMRLEI